MVMLPKHEPYVKANIRLIKRKNNAQDLKLILIRNTLEVSPSTFTSFYDDIIDIQHVGGYPQTILPDTDGIASYHHAMAINLGLQHINTRYLLVLDPDFYILRDNWIELVLSYMKTMELSFFGAPWHPKWYHKWRDFPCAHCLFIDLSRVQALHLDFLPGILRSTKDKPYNKKTSLHRQIGSLYGNFALLIKNKIEQPGFLQFFGKLAYYFLIHRKNIGQSRDTGYWLKHHYGGSSTHKNEQLIPIIDENQDFAHIPHMRTGIGHSIEHLIPPRFSYLPNIQSYNKSNLNSQNGDSETWERFDWKNKLFGIHKRLTMTASNITN
jgi:hypothetical protein